MHPHARDDTDSGTDTGTDTGRETRRLAMLALVVFGLLVLLHFTPLKAWIDDLQAFKGQIRGWGWQGVLAFTVASIAIIALGVPRLLLCGVAGVLFGFVTGSISALVASVAGAYGTFLFARWSGRGWAERKLAGSTVSAGLKRLLARPTIGTICIARQLPVPGIVINTAIGMLPTRHATFLLGTTLGYLPSNAVIALAGSSLGKDSLPTAITQATLAMGALGVLAAVMMWLRHRMSAGKE